MKSGRGEVVDCLVKGKGRGAEGARKGERRGKLTASIPGVFFEHSHGLKTRAPLFFKHSHGLKTRAPLFVEHSHGLKTRAPLMTRGSAVAADGFVLRRSDWIRRPDGVCSARFQVGRTSSAKGKF